MDGAYRGFRKPLDKVFPLELINFGDVRRHGLQHHNDATMQRRTMQQRNGAMITRASGRNDMQCPVRVRITETRPSNGVRISDTRAPISDTRVRISDTRAPSDTRVRISEGTHFREKGTHFRDKGA